MKYGAVIFDLDGTLLDTIGDIADAMNHALKSQNYPSHSDEEYNGMVGWGLDELVRRAVPEGIDLDAVRPKLKSLFLEHYREYPARRTTPYEGIETLLSNLVEENISLAILSNKPDELVQQVVAEILPVRYFAAVLGRSDTFPHKPDPASLQHILSELKVSPDEACLVGDSEIDMETARNGGVAAVAVSWGYRTLEALREAGAEITVHSTAELKRHLLNP